MNNDLNQNNKINEEMKQITEKITSGMQSYFEKSNDFNSIDRKTARKMLKDLEKKYSEDSGLSRTPQEKMIYDLEFNINKTMLLEASRKKTAVVYIRSASSENALEHSEEQLYLISKFAVLNDIRIEFVFKDLGVSSLNYYSQEGLYSSLNEIRNNKIDYLLIAEPSRISRKPYIYTAFQEELERFGTQILPVSIVKEMAQ